MKKHKTLLTCSTYWRSMQHVLMQKVNRCHVKNIILLSVPSKKSMEYLKVINRSLLKNVVLHHNTVSGLSQCTILLIGSSLSLDIPFKTLLENGVLKNLNHLPETKNLADIVAQFLFL